MFRVQKMHTVILIRGNFTLSELTPSQSIGKRLNEASIMKKMLLLLLMMLCQATVISEAVGQTNSPKYCGSGITSKIVPDNFMGCKFSDACKAHDVCYGKCDPGGEKYGSDYCKNSEFSFERIMAKLQCDTDLGESIKKINIESKRCSVFGGAYSAAVIVAGQGPFNGQIISPDNLNKLMETSKSSDELEQKLLKYYGMEDKKLGDLSQVQIILPSLNQGGRPAIINSDDFLRKNQKDISEMLRQRYQNK